jgi:hypothetical protein
MPEAAVCRRRSFSDNCFRSWASATPTPFLPTFRAHGVPRSSPVESSGRTQQTPTESNVPFVGPTRRPGGRGTRLQGASCAVDREPGQAHRCARAFRAAPPCGRGTPPPPGTYPPWRAGASSRNPRSFASSRSISSVIVPRLPLQGRLRSSHYSHRPSQPILRLAHHSVPFRGSAVVPTDLIFLRRAPKRCLIRIYGGIARVDCFGTFRRGLRPRQPYSPKYAEGKFPDVVVRSQRVA